MKDLLTEIFESVRRNKLRTCLTGLAVSWGIFMLILLLGAGNGLINAFLFSSGDVATNTMMVGPGRTSMPYAGYQKGRMMEMVESDMDILRKGMFAEKVDQISASSNRSGFTMRYGKFHVNSVNLCSTMPADMEMNHLTILEGRFINQVDIDMGRKVVILPHLTAKKFLGGDTDYSKIIGERVKIGDFSFQVVGVRKTAENTDDNDLYIPYTTNNTIFGLGEKIGQITFSFHGLETQEENEEFENQLVRAFNKKHSADPEDKSAFWVWNRFTQNMQLEKATGILQTALWIIGLLTLISGIVGVSNIMLITVKERKHEFGIRKAIGAKPWGIIKLILSESIAITAFFGFMGMVLGLVACEILDATVGQTSMEVFGESIQLLKNPTVGIGTAVGATVTLIVAGTLAGIFPARNAAKVKPIEALRG